jgi:signal transduction histidine kinase
VKLQLGVVRERVEPALGERLQRALELVDEGMRGIRNVTNDLRPSLLDDLGLLPALRSLVADYAERRGVAATLTAPDALPVLSDEGEVALFRALQESLANVARHADGAPVRVSIAATPQRVTVTVADTGPGFEGEQALAGFEAEGHLGLVGMRERILALGGTVAVRSARGRGVTIILELPAADGAIT